jgi:hypothetical protein
VTMSPTMRVASPQTCRPTIAPSAARASTTRRARGQAKRRYASGGQTPGPAIGPPIPVMWAPASMRARAQVMTCSVATRAGGGREAHVPGR